MRVKLGRKFGMTWQEINTEKNITFQRMFRSPEELVSELNKYTAGTNYLSEWYIDQGEGWELIGRRKAGGGAWLSS